MAPKSLNTPYISHINGHHICFILDRGGEANEKGGEKKENVVVTV